MFSQNSTVNNAPQTTTNTNTQSSVFAYAYTRNDDNISIANNSTDNVIEIIFECHEIYGKLSIGFAEYPSVEGMWAAELSLWEQLSRPLARRSFELYRGKKNKELMQSRSKELQRKSSELAEQGERLSSLEHVNTMTHQELQALITESERLRKILKHEQQQLQLTIQSKKQLNDHLKLTLQQVKEDFSKKEQQMQQEQKSLQHKVHQLQTDLVKKNSELSSYAVKEQLYKENKQTLLRQYESLLHQHEASEKHLLGLRKELGALEKQYSSLEVSEEVKMKALVGKIRGLEEEIDRQR
jgi:chromosome segregation ATPase